MKSFKLFAEKWLDSGKVHTVVGSVERDIEIFINPSISELNECGDDCRGILDKKGNLYVATGSGGHGATFIHADIINFLQKSGHLPKAKKSAFYDASKGITVQRWKNSKGIYLGESWGMGGTSKKEFIELQKMGKKFKKTNPGLILYPDSIKYHHYDKKLPEINDDWLTRKI